MYNFYLNGSGFNDKNIYFDNNLEHPRRRSENCTLKHDLNEHIFEHIFSNSLGTF